MPRGKRKPIAKEVGRKKIKDEEQSPQIAPTDGTSADVTPTANNSTLAYKAQKRKDYYLITTLLYIPLGLLTVREKNIFLQEETMPQIFSNERKAKEYMKERAEVLKGILLTEGSYIFVTQEVEEEMPKVIEKKFTPEDLTVREVDENTIILGFDKDSLFKADDYWGFLKFHAVALNGTLPPSYHRSASSSTIASSPSEPRQD